jgi:hypothetical protein
MNETQLWAFGLVSLALVGLGGILWRHMVSCSKDVSVPLAEMKVEMVQIKIFIDELRNMKHMRVDPYLPHEFNRLSERVEKLENK